MVEIETERGEGGEIAPALPPEITVHTVTVNPSFSLFLRIWKQVGRLVRLQRENGLAAL